jgi:hypothetical protein
MFPLHTKPMHASSFSGAFQSTSLSSSPNSSSLSTYSHLSIKVIADWMNRFRVVRFASTFLPGPCGYLSHADILALPSTPVPSPSYPRGPYTFYDREYFIVKYKSTSDALRRAVPAPLVPNKDNIVLYEWIAMPDSTGFGSYTESGSVIPCTFQGQDVNFTAQMFLNCGPCTPSSPFFSFPTKLSQPPPPHPRASAQSPQSPEAARSGGFPKSTGSRNLGLLRTRSLGRSNTVAKRCSVYNHIIVLGRGWNDGVQTSAHPRRRGRCIAIENSSERGGGGGRRDDRAGQFEIHS